MNLIEKIKKIFKPKEINEIKESTTTISLYDIQDIILPKYNLLNEQDKNLTLMYQNKININNLEEIIRYNQDIAKEGERLSNLLIKYLYKLNEVIRKDDKTEEELQKINIDLIIKTMKVVVIKEQLEKLLHDSYLKTLAIERYKEIYEKKEHKFIEIFSRAAKIKRNMELKSLEESETRGKITIKTITQQIQAINNAINNNESVINKNNIYTNLINRISDTQIRKEIYIEKENYYSKIQESLNWNFSKLSELQQILKDDILNKEKEINIIRLLAISDLELEKCLIDNKDKMLNYYVKTIDELNKVIIDSENKNKILNESEKLTIISQVFNEYISDIYKEEPYKIIFNVLTNNINIEKESPFVYYKSKITADINHYIKIISNKLNNLYCAKSPFAIKLKNEGNLKQMINLLNPYFKSQDGNYRYMDILFKNKLLALLLAFDSEEKFNNFFKEYKLSLDSENIVHYLPKIDVEWDSSIPLETLYELHELLKQEGKPMFYNIYKLYHEELGQTSKVKSDYYYLSEGLKFIQAKADLVRAIYPIIDLNFKNGYSIKEMASVICFSVDKVESYTYISSIKEKANNKIVVFPSTLKYIDGNVFGNYPIKGVKLNEGLEYIGYNVFSEQGLRSITFPKSVEKIKNNSFDYGNLKIIKFKDYQESKLLYSLLYSNDSEILDIIAKIFPKINDYEFKTYLSTTLEKICLSSEGERGIEITKDEIDKALNLDDIKEKFKLERIQQNIAKLIEAKIGVNLKEYHERKEHRNK